MPSKLKGARKERKEGFEDGDGPAPDVVAAPAAAPSDAAATPAAAPANAAADATAKRTTVTVPPGVVGGDSIRLTLSNGEKVVVEVPAELSEGQTFSYELPSASAGPRRFVGTAAFDFSAEEGELSLQKDDKVIVFPDLVGPAGWWVATNNFTKSFSLKDIGLVPCDFLADPLVPATPQDAVSTVSIEQVPAKGTLWARVLYNFEAKYDHELSVKPGQMLRVHPPSLAPIGWALVDRPPDRGIVPPNFFIILPDKQQALQGKAVADSQAAGVAMPAPIDADPSSFGVGPVGRNLMLVGFAVLVAGVFAAVAKAATPEQLAPHLIPLPQGYTPADAARAFATGRRDT